MRKYLYVDDLETPEKKDQKSYDGKYIQWLKNVAIENNCNYIHLDPGTHRAQAHTFYIQ